MEQGREEILNKMQSEKMCSLCGDGAGKMCSPADTDACGECLFAEESKVKNYQETMIGYVVFCLFNYSSIFNCYGHIL